MSKISDRSCEALLAAAAWTDKRDIASNDEMVDALRKARELSSEASKRLRYELRRFIVENFRRFSINDIVEIRGEEYLVTSVYPLNEDHSTRCGYDCVKRLKDGITWGVRNVANLYSRDWDNAVKVGEMEVDDGEA